MRSPPLAELYDLLREDGFAIGVDDHLRIGRLLARDAAWTPDMLRVAIGALVMTSADQQSTFDACWERWMPSVKLSRRAEIMQPTGSDPKPRWSRWLIMIASAIAITTVDFLIARTYYGGESHTQAIETEVAGVPPIDSAGISSPTGEPMPGGGMKTGYAPALISPSMSPLHSGIDVASMALVLGAIILATVAFAYALRACARRRFLPGPWRYTLAVPPARKPVLPPIAIEDAAADLSWRAQVGQHELDLERSVAATVACGGLPTPVHRQSLAPPRYLVLEDTACGTASWSFVYDELFHGLLCEGLKFERYTFAASPEQCSGPDGREIALSDLLDHADVLIAIGDGDAAVDALTEARATWLVQLRRVPRRLWINPFPPARWSTGARIIAADTPMEHGAASALAVLRASVDGRVERSGTYPLVLERAPGTASAILALRCAIGDRAFRLVAAVSVAGPPTISLARWLAETCSLELNEQDWLCIATLPWFRNGQWPSGLPERLSEALRADDPALAGSVAAIADRLLAASEPLRDSGAHLAWQMDSAFHAYHRGERAAAARMLNQMTVTPLAHQARGALAALGLRNRTRIMILSAIAVGAALVVGAVGSMMARRVAERHLEKVAGDGAQLPQLTDGPWPEAFAVRVVDGNGAPVSGARVVWSNPQLGPRSYIGTTDAAGLSRATQLYMSSPRNNLEQVAQVISRWDGPMFMYLPVGADGEKAVLRFSQIAAHPASPDNTETPHPVSPDDTETTEEPTIKTTKLIVEVKPDAAARGAKVFVDGKLGGPAFEIALDPGTTKKKIKVLVKAIGYKDVEQEIEVEDWDESTTLKLELSKGGRSKPPVDTETPEEPTIKTTKLIVEVKPDAASRDAKVFVDGKLGGPVFEIGLDPGTTKKKIKVLAKAVGYKDVEQEIEVEGESTTLMLELSKGDRSKPPVGKDSKGGGKGRSKGQGIIDI